MYICKNPNYMNISRQSTINISKNSEILDKRE